jgi:hypothetical protein
VWEYCSVASKSDEGDGGLDEAKEQSVSHPSTITGTSAWRTATTTSISVLDTLNPHTETAA